MEHVLSLSAIRLQKASLNRVILDAQAQLADLEVAERIVRRFGQETEAERPSIDAMDDLLTRAKIGEAKVAPSNPPLDGKLTTRAVFLAVLRQSADPWMTANEIQERASAIKGQEVPMSTVSPTLSNLKNSGLVERDGFKVALAERLNENGAPSGNTASAPETGSDANPGQIATTNPAEGER